MKYGTPRFALQELGGWESAEMVRRYAHLAADHLAPYAERLCAARAMESEPRHVLAVAKTARARLRKPLVWLRGVRKESYQHCCIKDLEPRCKYV